MPGIALILRTSSWTQACNAFCEGCGARGVESRSAVSSHLSAATRASSDCSFVENQDAFTAVLRSSVIRKNSTR